MGVFLHGAREDLDTTWQLLERDWRALDWLELVTDTNHERAQILMSGVHRMLRTGGQAAREKVRRLSMWGQA
jgi:hypothetical protein